jgi:FkbM family methyltransferase
MSFNQTIRKLLSVLYHKLPILRNNILAMNVILYLDIIFNMNRNIRKDAISFYSQNANRVNAIVNILADKKSKKIYMGMIKFRQTCSMKDFPFHIIKESQYFIKELKLGSDEIFVDGGAFNGDTIDQYLKYCKKYKHIIAFEPDFENFKRLKEKYENNSSITLINAGLYDRIGEIEFHSGCQSVSKIADGGEDRIQVRTIDGLGLEKVTFIKMDIEGAELSALKGAKKTILRDRPKLAICIYHYDKDMIDIVEYIHNLVPQYHLYIRQYRYSLWETVLYAVMP